MLFEKFLTSDEINMVDGHKACHLPFVVTDLWHSTKLEDLTVPNGHIKRNAITYLKTSRKLNFEIDSGAQKLLRGNCCALAAKTRTKTCTK